MKKADREMRSEYKRSDLARLERGKFFKEASQGNAGPPQVSLTPTGGGLGAARPWGRSKGTSVALIEHVLAKAFPTSEAVNAALRGLLAPADETARITGRSKRTARMRESV